jgi:peptidoglycan/xylan/chitin deacetylase (PgdA/CDA1 family)
MTHSSERYDYSPIHERPAGTWPGGKKLAVYLCLGVEEYRFGDGHTEDILADVPAPDLVNASWRNYGNRVGAFRLLDRLGEFQIPATVLFNTDVYDSAPAVAEAARRSGAELVAHGLSNSDSLSGMNRDEERAYLSAVSARIAAEEGSAPVGWSSPWLTHTESTVDLLAETGYDYLLDLRFDDQPVWLRSRTRPVLSIPSNVEINDSSSMVGRNVAASDFADMIVDEFDELLSTANQPLVMNVVVHSFISGAPFRLRQLSRALAHLAGRRDEVWFTQPKQIHAFAVRHPELFPVLSESESQEGAA